VIRAADEFRDKTVRPNELWQTDFTYQKVMGWGWFHLSTILDDHSRYIIAWKLCTTMKASDVTATLELALQASGCDQATVVHKPRRRADNGSSYVAADLADDLDACGIDHIRGAPHHPQTQGKIERWHQTLKNRILLEHYFLPGDLERQIAAFVDHDNNRRYHESLVNLTPADVHHGRAAQILKTREEIKKHTIRQRRLQCGPPPRCRIRRAADRIEKPSGKRTEAGAALLTQNTAIAAVRETEVSRWDVAPPHYAR
jgi:putative transposase